VIVSTLIVGAKFRPPALALLETLPMGTKLTVQREPTNVYDSNAIMVLVQTVDMQPSEALAERLPGFGFGIERLFAENEWHLGYIPRERAAQIAPLMDRLPQVVKQLDATLTCNAEGQTQVRFELPEGETGDA